MAKTKKSRPARLPNRPAPLDGNAVWKTRSRVRRAGPAAREGTWWDDLRPGVRHGLCLGFLLLVAVGFFWPTTFGGRTLAGGDTLRWRASAEAMIQYEEATGDEADWAPNMFGGMPGTLISGGPGVPGVDSVANGLRRLGLWPVAHAFVLLVGMYLLVFYLTRSALAGVVGAVAFGLSTYLPIILSAGHNSKFIALAYGPWLLLAFGALVRRGPDTSKLVSALLVLLFAVAASVNLRAGHVQITYYLVVVAVVWWLAEGVAAAREGRAATWLVSTGLLAVGSALALVIVADPYLAKWEYKAFTTRAAGPGGGLAWEYAMAWSQGLGELLTLVVPNAYGGGGATYWGPKTFTEGPHYVGPVVALLALVGVAGVARRSVVAFGVAALVTVVFALGEHVPLVNRLAFEGLPLFDAFRVPETWLSVTALLLALLAGWGAYYLQRREATPEAEDRKRRVALGAAATLALLVGGLWATGGGPLDFERPGRARAGRARGGPAVRAPVERPPRSDGGRPVPLGRRGRAPGPVFRRRRRALAPLPRPRRRPRGHRPVAAGPIVGRPRRARPPRHGRPVGRRAPVLQRGQRRAPPAGDAGGVDPRDGGRPVRRAAGGGGGRGGAVPRAPAEPDPERVPVVLLRVGRRLPRGQARPDPGLLRPAPPGRRDGPEPERAPPSSRRATVVAPGVPPGLRPVFQDPQTGLVVSEDSTALPRAFFADDVRVVEDEDALVARLRDPAFSPRETALLSAPPPDGVTAEALSGAAPDSGRRVRRAPAVRAGRGRVARSDGPAAAARRQRGVLPGRVDGDGGRRAGPDPADGLSCSAASRSRPASTSWPCATRRRPKQTGRLVSWAATLLTYVGIVAIAGLPVVPPRPGARVTGTGR